MVRSFTSSPASRQQVPLLLGLMGPSGSGKTYSALRLANGIVSVTGGDVYCIDTEASRALHYADKFKFEHVPFDAPFSPADYLEALKFCVAKGAKVIIVDSMSHEHEGVGGVLEMHDAEVERMGGGEQNNFRAWSKPKAERRKLIAGLLQMNCNFIFCFRAKEKTSPGVVNGKKTLVNMGWMPIAGEEFIYEQTANMLLLPGSNGVPSWRTEYPGERAMMKIPEQFRGILDTDGAQLSEAVGASLARWAQGGTATPSKVDHENLCAEAATRGTAELERVWLSLPNNVRKELKPKLDAWKKTAAAVASHDAAGSEGPADAPALQSAGPTEARIEEARETGLEHAREGRALRAMPAEFSDVPELKAAYEDGFKSAIDRG